jgi:DNA-binding CsgD family transcriptional regulator/PAS domain-containing protein
MSIKTQPVINPALEKPLLKLHRAIDVRSFGKAVHQLLSGSIPNHCVGSSLQQSPGVPLISRWTLRMPGDFFVAEPLRSYTMHPRRKKLVRLADLFGNHNNFKRSAFYRRYMVPQNCAHGVAMFFWKRQRVICTIVVLRSARQGNFSSAELKLLRQLYAQFLAALRRIESLERERLVRVNFQQFLRRLPLPTIILRWDLKPIYQNPAAREFCAIWEKGAEEAKRTKASSPVPAQIVDQCRLLKQRWLDAQLQMPSGRQTEFIEEQVQHPGSPGLRATIQVAQVKSARVARPHFLIACEDLCRNGSAFRRPQLFHLPAFARLTRREREVAQLACEGHSNKEIAQNACLSLQTVKKHLHSIFRKLQVPSRTRLVALAT